MKVTGRMDMTRHRCLFPWLLDGISLTASQATHECQWSSRTHLILKVRLEPRVVPSLLKQLHSHWHFLQANEVLVGE